MVEMEVICSDWFWNKLKEKSRGLFCGINADSRIAISGYSKHRKIDLSCLKRKEGGSY